MPHSKNNSLWQSYLDSFKQASRAQDYQTAQIIVDSAFNDARRLREIDQRFVWCIYSLSSFYLSYGHNNEAAELYKKLNKLKERLLGKTHPDLFDSLEKLALIQVKVKTKFFARSQIQSVMAPYSVAGI